MTRGSYSVSSVCVCVCEEEGTVGGLVCAVVCACMCVCVVGVVCNGVQSKLGYFTASLVISYLLIFYILCMCLFAQHA